MITMTEIARLTHVSQPTVSRVLNGNPKVSPEIRERVLACAREHDYQLNALAKGLTGGPTHLLGVLVTDISNGFFADLAKEIETAARERGYSILLFNSDYDPDREQEYLDVVRRYRVDGVLAVPIRETSPQWYDYVQRLDVRVVTITRRAEGLDSFYADHAAAGPGWRPIWPGRAMSDSSSSARTTTASTWGSAGGWRKRAGAAP